MKKSASSFLFCIVLLVSSCAEETNIQSIEKTDNGQDEIIVNIQGLSSTQIVQNYVSNNGLSYIDTAEYFGSLHGLSIDGDVEQDIINLLIWQHMGNNSNTLLELVDIVKMNESFAVEKLINSYLSMDTVDYGIHKIGVMNALSYIGGNEAYSFLYEEMIKPLQYSEVTHECGEGDPLLAELELVSNVAYILHRCYKFNGSENCKQALLDALSADLMEGTKRLIIVLLKDLGVAHSEIENYLDTNEHDWIDESHFLDMTSLPPIEEVEEDDSDTDPVCTEECIPPTIQ